MHYPALNTRTVLGTLIATLTVAGAGAQPYAYVSNLSGNNISVLNTSTNTVTATISACTSPSALAVTPNGARVYIPCQGTNAVVVMNTANNSMVANIPVGTTPVQLAVNPNGTQVYVVNRGSNSVSVIDTTSNSVIGTIAVGSRPLSIAFNSNGSRAYVANLWGANVSIIDTASRSVIGTFAPPAGPNSLAVAPNGRVYASSGNNVTVHDASGSLLGNVGGFSSPDWVAVSPNGSRVVVANGNGASVSILDPNSLTITKTIPTGTIPTSVAISADSARAYVTNEYSLSLSVIDLASGVVTKTVAYVGAYPIGVAMQPGASSSQPPPACSFSLSAASASFNSPGGSGSVNVSAPTGCGWSVSNSLSWVHINSATSATGSGTVSYTVDANLAAGQKSGSFTIAGQTYSVTQAGLACSYTLSSTSISLAHTGGAGSVNVTAGVGCSWSASSDQPSWLSITAGTGGSGNGTVSYSATSNPGTAARTGHLTIGGHQFTVTQAGSSFSPIRVRCGGPQVTDASGNVWVSDNSTKYSVTDVGIAGTTSPALYQTDAWSTGTLQRQYSVPNGSFTVTLKFAEFYLTSAGHRTFNIVVNGTTFYSSFDILAHVAANTAYDVQIPVVVSNGQITIQLVPVTGTPKLNGIQIN